MARTTAERGYGSDHQAERARWQPVVDAGRGRCHAVKCLMPTRHIRPGSAWDLGHLPDRTGWSGPEHAHCNRVEGAKRGNKARRKKMAALFASRSSKPKTTTVTAVLPRSRDW